MTSQRHNQLLEKRKELQLRNRFNEFVKTDIMPFTEVLNELNNSGIKYRFVSLRSGRQFSHHFYTLKNLTVKMYMSKSILVY